MSNKIPIAVMMLALAGGLRANGQQQTQTATPAPQLRLSSLSGKVDVMNPVQSYGGIVKDFPTIRSGATVRIVSGDATFESNNHAVIQARKNDSFLFTALESSATWPASFTIASKGGVASHVLITAGNQQFLLRENGTVSVASTGPGQDTVKVEGGNVQYLGSNGREGASLASVHPLPDGSISKGDTVIVQVPPAAEFEAAPLTGVSLTVLLNEPAAVEAVASQALSSSEVDRVGLTEKTIAPWPEISRTVAALTMEKYGPPSRISDRSLVWNDNVPWRRTVVYRTGTFRNFPEDHEDVIEQTIGYDIPQDKISVLENLGIGLKANVDNKELSSTSQSEEANFLAINLANDVVNGSLSADSARAAYAKDISLSKSGKYIPYMDGLLFVPNSYDHRQ